MYCFEHRESRIVTLQNLRKSSIEILHGENQGATAMLSKAQVNDCQCCFNTPPGSKEPLIIAPIPEYPFQDLVADLFGVTFTHNLHSKIDSQAL